jgi:hypothetical protein
LRVPQGYILLSEWDIVTFRVAACATAGFSVKHERQQSQRFGLFREQFHEQPAEEHRLPSKVAPGKVGTTGIHPTFSKCGIDRRQHCVESLGKFLALGNLEQNACPSDLVLGTDKSLAHCGRGREESGGDCLRIESEDYLQHQWGSRSGLDRGMSANEHQCEAPVWNRSLSRRRFSPAARSRNVSVAAPK